MPFDVPAVPVAVHVAEKLHVLSLPRVGGRENPRGKGFVDVVLLRQAALADLEAAAGILDDFVDAIRLDNGR